MKKLPKLVLRDDLVTKSGKARIEFLIYFEGKQYRIASGKSIEPKYWQKESEIVDKRSEDATKINAYLVDRLSEYSKYKSRKDALEEKIQLEELKRILKGLPLEEDENEIGKSTFPSISESIEKYIGYRKMKPGSVNNLRITKNVLVEFCIAKYKRELNINQVDYTFLLNFTKYLREDRQIPNSQNTIAKRLKLLKMIIRYSIKVGKKLDNPFLNYTIEHGKHREVALSEKEYTAIKTVTIPASSCKSLKLAKQVFIFCCETGLRYSDAMDLSWSHIDEKMTSFEKLQVKTGQPVFVPISNQAKALMVIYKSQYKDTHNHVFPRIDIQVMNRYLKDLAKLAGIDKNLTSHVARHTFGTRLGASGMVSAFLICELMGHKDVGMSQRYINLSKDDLKNTMKRVWDNNRQSLK